MRTANGFHSGSGGRRIYWQRWAPDRSPRAAIVIVHGVSEHSDRYVHVAEALVADGFAVYALDHRGHGRSDGPRAVIDRLASAVADVDQLVVQTREEHPQAPIHMLGHSMGGAISLCYATEHQDRLSGLILSSPLAALKAAPAPLRVLGRILSRVAPNLPLVGIDASLVSRDPAVVQAYVSDPLVYHGKLPARTVAELTAAIDGFPESVRSIAIPTLILYGTADGLCPPEGSLMLAERISAPDKTIKAYDGLYHEILNEPERDQVLADILAWLGEHVGSEAGAASGVS